MPNSIPLTVFKAGSNQLPYASALFMVIAVILPIYLYPGFFLGNVLNYFPFIVISIFIGGYNIVQYRKRATVELYEDLIAIIMTNKKVVVHFTDIQDIEENKNYGKKLIVIKTKSGREIALFDRKLITFKMTLLEYINSRTLSIHPKKD
ncbi:MAG: hypothetical protein ACYCSO_03930 [Cuniculiplasma sp.]